MATFIATGDFVDYTPSSDVTAGDVVVQNDLIGIAVDDIGEDVLGALRVEGVFSMTIADEDFAAGTDVFWNEDDEKVTADSESGAWLFFGKTVESRNQLETAIRVKKINAPDASFTAVHSSA